MLGLYFTFLTAVNNTTDEAVNKTMDEITKGVENAKQTLASGNWESIKNALKALVPSVLNGVQTLVFNIVLALVIFFVGKKIIKSFLKFMNNVFEKSKLDESVSKFLISVIKTVSNFILFLFILDTLGFKVTGIAALLGSAGLAIGLSLQGSLQNFAGGVLILLLKPFKLGDYIIAEGYEGTVETIDIFYTKLLTIDNRMVVLPNGTLSNTNITNVTNEDYRRLDLTVGISYSQEIGKVKDLLLKIAHSKELVLMDHEVVVYVDSFGDSAIMMGIRVWCRTENYWTLRWDMLETIKNEFDANGISIPYNQLDVKITGGLEQLQEKK